MCLENAAQSPAKRGRFAAVFDDSLQGCECSIAILDRSEELELEELLKRRAVMSGPTALAQQVSLSCLYHGCELHHKLTTQHIRASSLASRALFMASSSTLCDWKTSPSAKQHSAKIIFPQNQDVKSYRGIEQDITRYGFRLGGQREAAHLCLRKKAARPVRGSISLQRLVSIVATEGQGGTSH
eukprot:2263791-Rhodomonas_salina.1